MKQTELRRKRMNELKQFIKDNPKISSYRIVGVYCFKSGLCEKTIKEYLRVMEHAKVLNKEYNEGLNYYRVSEHL